MAGNSADVKNKKSGLKAALGKGKVGAAIEKAAEAVTGVSNDAIANALGLPTEQKQEENLDEKISDTLTKSSDVGIRLVFGYISVTRFYTVDDNAVLNLVNEVTVDTPSRGEGLESRIFGLTDKGWSFVHELEKRPITKLATVSGLVINSGVGTIIGGANSAKSPLLLAIATQAKMNIVLFGEPVGGGTTSSARLAAIRILDALTDPKGIGVAIDSIKNLVSRSQGASMSKGTSRELLPMLSDWSTLAIQLGKSIITVVNIGTDDAAAVKEYEEAVLTNVTSRYSVNTPGTGNFTVTTRMGYALKRLEQKLSLTWSNGLPVMASTTKDTSALDRDPVMGQIKFGRGGLNRIDNTSENLLGFTDVESARVRMPTTSDSSFARVLQRQLNARLKSK